MFRPNVVPVSVGHTAASLPKVADTFHVHGGPPSRQWCFTTPAVAPTTSRLRCSAPLPDSKRLPLCRRRLLHGSGLRPLSAAFAYWSIPASPYPTSTQPWSPQPVPHEFLQIQHRWPSS